MAGKKPKSTKRVGVRIVKGQPKVTTICGGNKGIVGSILKAMGK